MTKNLEAAMLLGQTYDIGHGYGIHAPTLRQVIEFGQNNYYHVVGLLTAISSDCKAPLFDMGFDWVDVTDMQMFVMATRGLTVEESAIVFDPVIDFSALRVQGNDDGDLRLLDADGNVVLDDESRARISQFLCKLHNIVKRPERPYNKYAHDQLIEESRMALAQAKKRSDDDANALWPLISYVANAPGSKYDYESCLDMRMSTFMDCVSRLQIIVDATALHNACYSGMIDSSKIKKESLNAMRTITPPKTRQAINFR